MPSADPLASVRSCVQQAFTELDFGSLEAGGETILIRGGNYCGRRFDGDAGHAIWFAEEDQLKFIDAQGRVVRVVDRATFFGRPLRVAA